MLIVRIGRGHPPPDGEALVVAGERAWSVARIPLHVAGAIEADGEIALPDQVVGVDLDELAGDGNALLIGRKRIRLVAGVEQRVADAAQGGRDVALQIGVAGVRGGELLADGEAFPVGRERTVIVAGVELGVADAGNQEGDIALLARVGLDLGQLARDGEAIGIGGQGARIIAGAILCIAQRAQRLRQLALQLRVGLVPIGQALLDVAIFLQGDARACEVAGTKLEIADGGESLGQIALAFGIVGVLLGVLPADGQALLVFGKCHGDIAGVEPGLANFLQLARIVLLPLIALGHLEADFEALRRACRRFRPLAFRRMGQGKLVEHGDLHAEELLVAGRLGDGLAEGLAHLGEDLVADIAHSRDLDVAQTPRDVDHERIGDVEIAPVRSARPARRGCRPPWRRRRARRTARRWRRSDAGATAHACRMRR